MYCNGWLLLQVIAFESCHKLIKFQLQNLDQASASKSWLKISLNIPTKVKPSKFSNIAPARPSTGKWPITKVKTWVFRVFYQNHLGRQIWAQLALKISRSANADRGHVEIRRITNWRQNEFSLVNILHYSIFFSSCLFPLRRMFTWRATS